MAYYGYKLYAVCTINGVFTDFEIVKASIHDIYYLKNIKNDYQDCYVLADKAYLNIDYQLDLFQTKNIRLETPMRKNQYGYKSQLLYSENRESALRSYSRSYVTSL